MAFERLRLTVLSDMGEGKEALSRFLLKEENFGLDDYHSSCFVAAAALYNPREVLSLYRRSAQAIRRKVATEGAYRFFQFSPDLSFKKMSQVPSLRVGFVSADFVGSSLAQFITPLLEHLINFDLEIHLYSNSLNEVASTLSSLLRQSKKVRVHNVKGLAAKECAELIKSHQIEVLIDLSGYTDGNRLDVFCLKPVDISITFGGSGESTGLTEIDYILTSRILCPSGDYYTSEKPIYLEPPVCFTPRPSLINSVCGSREGDIVELVSFTRGVRMNEEVYQCWASILKACPNTRLSLNSRSFACGAIPHLLKAALDLYQVGLERVTCKFEPLETSVQTADLLLDTFPQNSGTTLIEAAYCGLPFITMSCRPGGTGRLGHLILEALELSENVTYDVESYVGRAIELCSSRALLENQKAFIRTRMRASTFMNLKKYSESFYIMLQEISKS